DRPIWRQPGEVSVVGSNDGGIVIEASRLCRGVRTQDRVGSALQEPFLCCLSNSVVRILPRSQVFVGLITYAKAELVQQAGRQRRSGVQRECLRLAASLAKQRVRPVHHSGGAVCPLDT